MTLLNKPAKDSKGLHPRNLHRQRYDFVALQKVYPELSAAVSKNAYGDNSIDFADPESVILLNQALLKYFYQVSYWAIPQGYLCPPIPGRADYLHYLADLLAESYSGDPQVQINDKVTRTIPRGKKVIALDVGMGANCVYPIIGSRQYGWQFIGSDIDPAAVKFATMLAASNPSLSGHIECRLQTNPQQVFKGILGEKERVDITLCNPPFHRSLKEAARGSERKINNLANNAAKRANRSGISGKPASIRNRLNAGDKPALNFGGQGAELWCDGGEAAFIKQMIRESADFSRQCLWFSTLVSKKDNLAAIYRTLQETSAIEVKTVEMQQGQKMTRFVAWTFLSNKERRSWWL
jgi:23S rRNA (adenine1618-N6)-methyltransferase